MGQGRSGCICCDVQRGHSRRACWLGKETSRGGNRDDIDETLGVQSSRLSNRKWICGDIDDDALWKEDGEMMLVWRLLDDEKMKKESRDSDVIVVKGGGRTRWWDQIF